MNYIWTMAKGNHIDISVPVKPHVHQYLSYLYGGTILPVSAYDPLLLTGFMLLHRSRGYFGKADYDINYPSELTLRLPFDLTFEGRLFISKESIISFNAYIERSLKMQLFGFLDMIIATSSVKIKEGILCFLKRYEIDEKLWKYETLKKAYYRYRKNPRKFYGGMSPKISPLVALKKVQKFYELTKAS